MKRSTIFFISCLAAAAVCSCQKETGTLPVAVEEESGSTETVPGSLNVKFTTEMADLLFEAMSKADSLAGESLTRALSTKAGGETAELFSKMEGLGVESLERVFPYAGKWEARHREAGLHTWYRMKYSPETASTKASASLADASGVLMVEPTPKLKPTASAIPFNDPYRSYMWNLYNDGSIYKGFKSGADINVVPVWAEFTAGSKDVIVAVVDTGVDESHEDLAGVVLPGGEGGSKSFVYGHEGYSTGDGSHGTHVAGTIAAINNNGTGICGIAGGSDGTGGVRIMSCQMMMEASDGSTLQGNSAAAIVWGADNGAVISQNSWGYGYDTEAQARAGGISSADAAAIDYFIKYAGFDENGVQTGPMAGGVVFFAAGNDAWQYAWPSQYEDVVAVGAIGPDGKRATYSNYGDWVDIAAPGGEADRFGTTTAYILSTASGSYYFMCGTSMACPHVSGVAALLVSHFGGEGFTAEDLKEKLIIGANWNTTSVSENIGPQLDAYGAFKSSEASAPVISTEYSGGYTFKSHESATIEYSITTDSSIPLSVELSSGFSGVTLSKSDESVAVVEIDALAGAPGTYSYTLTASQGNIFSTSLTQEFTIEENHAPVVTQEISSFVVEGLSEAVRIDLGDYISDEDGEDLSYDMELSVSNVVSASLSGNVLTLTPRKYGSVSISLSAEDARGEKCALRTFSVLVYDTSIGFSAYPVPVTDVLRLHSGSQREMTVSITNSNGVEVYAESISGSAFSPARIDLSAVAPGQLQLSVSYDGKKFTRAIVKE